MGLIRVEDPSKELTCSFTVEDYAATSPPVLEFLRAVSLRVRSRGKGHICRACQLQCQRRHAPEVNRRRRERRRLGML